MELKNMISLLAQTIDDLKFYKNRFKFEMDELLDEFTFKRANYINDLLNLEIKKIRIKSKFFKN